VIEAPSEDAKSFVPVSTSLDLHAILIGTCIVESQIGRSPSARRAVRGTVPRRSFRHIGPDRPA
jgi:hypothetical protein